MTLVEKIKYPLKSIYFYLTEGCNLKCRHCWIATKYQSDGKIYPALPFDLFQSIIKQAKPLGIKSVKLTGGEPLLHPQINDILDNIRQEDLGVSIETNGVLCTPEIVQKISVCKNSNISVSLDGADAETHEWVRGVHGCFDDTLQGIRNLVDGGLKPQIIMSIMRHNKVQMEDIVRLAENLGASSVKFNIVEPISRGEKMHLSKEVPTIDELVEIGKWVETELSETSNINIYYGHPIAFQPLGKILENNGNRCNVCGVKGILGVLADGSYSLCGIGETVPELILGHASFDSLEHLWNTSSILNEIRTGLPNLLSGICGKCLMRVSCLGCCIAQKYSQTKSVFTPYWFCEAAFNNGLFPLSRMGEN